MAEPKSILLEGDALEIARLLVDSSKSFTRKIDVLLARCQQETDFLRQSWSEANTRLWGLIRAELGLDDGDHWHLNLEHLELHGHVYLIRQPNPCQGADNEDD